MLLLVGALTIGLILSLLALGVFISFRIFAFPDITAEGSLTLGAAVAAVLLVAGVHPVAATLAAFGAGTLAGSLTGVIHTRFGINRLISGILVMTALYSVNLHIMGKSNVPLLSERTLAAGGPPTQWTRTTCAYCGVGCGFDAGVRDGRVVTMMPADDAPSNLGHACMKGRFGWTYVYAEDRVLVPRLRQSDRWTDITWDEALDRMAREFSRIKDAHGGDALATISSSRGTNEEN